MTHLHHLTLTTGHSRRSAASEVTQETRLLLAPVLREALQGGRPTIPGFSSYSLTGTARGRQASVWSVHGAGLLITFAVGGTNKASREWRMLGGTGKQPQLPWCVARIEDGIATDPEAAHWLGDLERCVAWTWLEDLT